MLLAGRAPTILGLLVWPVLSRLACPTLTLPSLRLSLSGGFKCLLDTAVRHAWNFRQEHFLPECAESSRHTNEVKCYGLLQAATVQGPGPDLRGVCGWFRVQRGVSFGIFHTCARGGRAFTPSVLTVPVDNIQKTSSSALPKAG